VKESKSIKEEQWNNVKYKEFNVQDIKKVTLTNIVKDC